VLFFDHRRAGQFFLGGLSQLCPKNFSTAPEKTAMLSCKITLPDSPHPVIISKNPGFRALYLARQYEFRFFTFNKYKKMFFFIFGCWLLPKKFSFCPKNNGFAQV